MSHEMLTLQAHLLNGHEAICVWAVIENWSVDEEGGHNELLYANQADAIPLFSLSWLSRPMKAVFTDGRTGKIFSSSATRSAMNAGWMAIIAAITMKSFWRKSP